MNLRPPMQRLFVRKLHLFQKHNAWPHTAKLTKTCLRSKCVPILKWPAKSPDLSPIKNILKCLERRMTQHRPRNTHQLKGYL